MENCIIFYISQSENSVHFSTPTHLIIVLTTNILVAESYSLNIMNHFY